MAIACKTQLSTIIDCNIHVPAGVHSPVPRYTPVVVFVAMECEGNPQNYVPSFSGPVADLTKS